MSNVVGSVQDFFYTQDCLFLWLSKLFLYKTTLEFYKSIFLSTYFFVFIFIMVLLWTLIYKIHEKVTNYFMLCFAGGCNGAK